MTKHEFLAALHNKLSGLPENEIEERLTFYNEMIDDGMDEGLSEEEAVARIGVIEDTEIPDCKPEKAKQKLSPWAILLLVLCAPLWVSLLLTSISMVISLYASLWSVIISLWATEIALWGAALGGAVGGIALVCTGNTPAGVALMGAGFICAGLSLFLLYGCKAATKGTALLTKKIAQGIRKCFSKKEDA
ncbi:MAG: DUF1700 domain-containing protein [Oscillospiraceae bacterium]|nr:DUF1700 domain-containing protein [Oscillospiraceae bacterium]